MFSMQMKFLKEYKRRKLKNYGLAMPPQTSRSILLPLVAFDQDKNHRICRNGRVLLNEVVVNAHSIHFAK